MAKRPSKPLSKLELTLAEFLKAHHKHGAPLLLAFSGGPDSLSLLHLLMRQRKKLFDLHLAHIDHGWREESAREAQQLKEMAERLNLPFHLKTLSPQDLEGNLEASSREARLCFFQELYAECHFQAVLFAHHADDQAETVLTRLFEGASLPHLGGMKQVTRMGALKECLEIWRPLLTHPKQDLLMYLEESSLKEPLLVPIQDRTNVDPRFRRARMRTQLFPQLATAFGKKIGENLCRLGNMLSDVATYLDERILPYWSAVYKGVAGVLVDVIAIQGLHPFELQHFLRRFCEREGVCPSREVMEMLSQLLISGVSNRWAPIWDQEFHIDRGRLFLLHKEVSKEIRALPSVELELSDAAVQYGHWRVTVTATSTANLQSITSQPTTNWLDLWQGLARVTLPAGDYTLGAPVPGSLYPRSHQLTRWWTNHKIPSFLGQYAPVVWSGGRICHEFLTGKVTLPPSTNNITLELRYILLVAENGNLD